MYTPKIRQQRPLVMRPIFEKVFFGCEFGTTQLDKDFKAICVAIIVILHSTINTVPCSSVCDSVDKSDTAMFPNAHVVMVGRVRE